MKQDFDVEDFRGMVNFLLKELDKEHKEKTEYYRRVIKNLDELIAGKKNGKTKKSIQGNKKRG